MADLPAIDALSTLELLVDRVESNPLKHIQWTPPQMGLLQNREPRVLLRTGNQFGKTYAGLAECIFRCIGSHPYKPVRPAPIEAWIITTSWSQSLSIQAKLWALLPKNELKDECTFDPVRGFRGITPVVEFKNGSIIRIKTSKQGGLTIAGATIHYVLCDEPLPKVRYYSELDRRLMRTGGVMHKTMTPVNARVDWVKELVEEGKLIDLHYSMQPENFIPVGQSEPLTIEDSTGLIIPMDQTWIDGQRSSVLSYEAPVILDGEWEFRSIGRVFEGYIGEKFTIPNLTRSPLIRGSTLKLCLGVDYGEESLRTCAVLVAVDTSKKHPRLFILGEYVPQTASTEEMDAAGILAMLASVGVEWSDLDHAYGDKRYTDSSGYITKKSNKTLQGEVERALKVNSGTLRPRLRGAKRGRGAGRGAVMLGVRWLHSAMIRPDCFYIDARCKWGNECFNGWDGDPKGIHKDWIDALRYALRAFIISSRKNKLAG